MLWDVDGTLLNAGGVGTDLYNVVFLQLFGRSLEAFAPMAGRTDRAIILQTLELAGVPEPRRYVDPFIAGLTAHAPSVREKVAVRGRAMPGAAAALAALSVASPLGAAGDSDESALGSPGPPGPSGPSGPRPARVHQSVLTGNIRPVAEVKLSAVGLRDPLDLCIGAYGDDHEVRTELVQVARRRAAAVHGTAAGDFDGMSTVLIGDTPLDIEAALAAGARAVGVATGSSKAAELLAAGAHVVLPDLTDTRQVLRALLPLLSQVRDEPGQRMPPAQLLAAAHRRQQALCAGKPALVSAGHPAQRLVGAACGVGEVQDRGLDRCARENPAPEGRLFAQVCADVDPQPLCLPDPPARRHRQVNRRRRSVGQSVQFGCRLVA